MPDVCVHVAGLLPAGLEVVDLAVVFAGEGAVVVVFCVVLGLSANFGPNAKQVPARGISSF